MTWEFASMSTCFNICYSHCVPLSNDGSHSVSFGGLPWEVMEGVDALLPLADVVEVWEVDCC